MLETIPASLSVCVTGRPASGAGKVNCAMSSGRRPCRKRCSNSSAAFFPAAGLDVGLHRHRVVALHQGIEQLMYGDRLAALEALGEIVALEEPRHGVARSEPDHPFGAELVGPLGVEEDLRARRIEDFEHLI